MNTETDTRVTDLTKCVDGPWYPGLKHGGYTHYRIWQQFDGLRWFQRHEWKFSNGSAEMEGWIPSYGSFLPHANAA